jgi:hypothetical protein
MKIRVNSSSRAGGGEVLVPGDPVPPLDLDDFFVVDSFETDKTEGVPFSKVKVNWNIEPKNVEVRVEDFEFRLVAPPQVKINEITARGDHTFTLLRTTSLRLEGRRNGSPFMQLGSSITVSVDESNCRHITLPGNWIDQGVFDELEQLNSDTAQLRLRSVSVPADPEKPDAPRERVQLQPNSEWDFERITYYFPLEIVTPNFFNADLDVWMEVGIVVTHDEDTDEERDVNDDGFGSTVDIRIEFDLDVDYSPLEDVLSVLTVGSTPVVAKTIEALLPLVLECEKRNVEEMTAERLLKNEFVDNALQNGRLFDIRIVPQNSYNHIEIVICEEPSKPEAPSGGVVTQ